MEVKENLCVSFVYLFLATRHCEKSPPPPKIFKYSNSHTFDLIILSGSELNQFDWPMWERFTPVVTQIGYCLQLHNNIQISVLLLTYGIPQLDFHGDWSA